MKSIPFYLFLLIATAAVSSFKTSKCKQADLAIVKIFAPDYLSEIEGTAFVVEFKNRGKKPSKPTKARLFDLDISAHEAYLQGHDSLTINMLLENNALAEWYAKDTMQTRYDIDYDKYDYDPYFETFQEIPALNPGEKHSATFLLPNHWIYNPNCEIRVLIDEDEKQPDCDRSNNTMDFFGWG